ncbi:unnamed protein product, partial [Scytosiphon promiscuus]
SRQKYHFTLISNEYHLSRIIMVHQISEGVSLLAPLKQLQASWGYEQVPYPYACYDDETKKFRADVYKTLEELVPLQVNVQAVASREEFFQEENYASLAHVQERLKDFIRQMQSLRATRSQKVDLADGNQWEVEQGRGGKPGAIPARGSVGGNDDDNDTTLGEALEWAAGALAKIQEIIEPAATRRNSVSLRAWAMCAALLERAILQAQLSADPDRPLKPSEWGLLEDEKPPPKATPEDKKRLITRRARDRARAFVAQDYSSRGESWDDQDDGLVVDGRGKGHGRDGDGGGDDRVSGRRRQKEEEGEEDALLLLRRRREEEALAQRRRRELLREGATVLHWAGADTRKELSLEDDSAFVDGGVLPWEDVRSRLDAGTQGSNEVTEGNGTGAAVAARATPTRGETSKRTDVSLETSDKSRSEGEQRQPAADGGGKGPSPPSPPLARRRRRQQAPPRPPLPPPPPPPLRTDGMPQPKSVTVVSEPPGRSKGAAGAEADEAAKKGVVRRRPSPSRGDRGGLPRGGANGDRGSGSPQLRSRAAKKAEARTGP